jgi:alanyl aminopeptidase
MVRVDEAGEDDLPARVEAAVDTTRRRLSRTNGGDAIVFDEDPAAREPAARVVHGRDQTGVVNEEAHAFLFYQQSRRAGSWRRPFCDKFGPTEGGPVSLRPVRPLVVALAALAPPIAFAQTDAGRLGRDVMPTFESVRLVLDPAQAEYTGSAHVELKVARPTASFSFHAEGPVLSSLRLRGASGEVALRHTIGARGLVRAEAERPLPAGAYTLDLEFKAPFGTKAVGLYRTVVAGLPYAFTQFEADDARKAFPCWDEPSFKIPYQLTAVVPADVLAVSNTPVESETPGGASKTVVFKRTPPLPSYLLAMAVGPFDTVPIPGMSVPGRVVTVKGSGGLAAEAVRVTPPILAALERYFGRPYPFEKLDLIAVPEFWFGAMENPGAITYADRFLLVDPKTAPILHRRAVIEVTAHELAHMWFGDLVTMAWWDDIWLNESFASWMGDKVTHETFPETDIAVRSVQGAQYAMETDARLTTRVVRQPVKATDNLMQIFDELAYVKGEAVLGMLEVWLGPEVVRKGIRDYLAAHEWGNATAADLWSALSRAAGKDVGRSMATFLDQAGVPLVRAELVDRGKSVRLTQRRFVKAGTAAPPTLWQIPVVLKYTDGGPVQTKAVLLTGRTQDFKLDAANPPVIWIHPNSGERGYYRWAVARPLLTTMAEQATRRLDPRERVGFVGNLTSLLEGGELRAGDYLRLLGTFTSDPEPAVVTAVLNALKHVRAALITPDVGNAFATYLRRTLGGALERIGPAARPGEPESTAALRESLILWLGIWGDDPRVQAYARELASAYFADASRVDATLAGGALAVAAAQGDPALFERLRKRLETSTDPVERGRMLYALSFQRAPALIDQALRYALDPALRSNEVMFIPRVMRFTPEGPAQVFRWTMDHYDDVARRIPQQALADMPTLALGEACSEDRLLAARAFFADAKHAVPGTEKELAEATEVVRDCIALRAREGASIAAYLRTVDPR